MDQPTTTPQITTPTLSKDIALPETPAPSHFLRKEGLEHLKKEEVEEAAEFEETKVLSSEEQHHVLGEFYSLSLS